MSRYKISRNVWKACSNNNTNPNKNICALAVAQAFYVDDETRYLHTTDDVLRALRKCWSVFRVRYSSRETLSKFKSDLRKMVSGDDTVIGYVIHVQGHVLAVSPDGKMVVDTAPDDNNIVLKVWAVRHPAPTSKAAFRNWVKFHSHKTNLTTAANQCK
jgi:hypothetical protein